MSAASIAAGTNANAENFESTASPVHAPNIALCAGVDFSIQMRAAKNDAHVNAASAISVVASPACARTGGRKVNRATASTAVRSSRYLRAHISTTTEAIQKNGRIPR